MEIRLELYYFVILEIFKVISVNQNKPKSILIITNPHSTCLDKSCLQGQSVWFGNIDVHRRQLPQK